MEIKKGDVVQVSEAIPKLTGCLMIVNNVYNWGVEAGMKIPSHGTEHYRLSFGQFERIGRVVFVEKGLK